jgi:capsular polysaccharide transport system permease protein
MKIWSRQSPLITTPEAPSISAESGFAGWSGPVAEPMVLAPRPNPIARLWQLAKRHSFVTTVCLPTLLAAIYFFLVAAPIYVSEARFLVRGRQQQSQMSGVSEMMMQAGFRAASDEALGIRDYLGSHDAVAALRQRLDLVALFRRPEADYLARLWWANPPAERLLKYYNRMVQTDYDTTSGITTLSAYSFRPEDSRQIANELLSLSEDLVNRLNQRVQVDALKVARDEVTRAEARVTIAQARLTEFRERERALDPGRAATLTVETIGKLEGDLIQARAELAEAQGFARGANPRLLQLRNRVASLTTQVADERQRLAGVSTGVTQQVGEFESLSTERELARTQLATANAAMERAMADAQRQQIFLMRLVEPNLAERALYPKATLNVLYLFVCLSVVYGIAWLLIAGTREHAS